MKVDDIHLVGIGTAKCGTVQTADAVADGRYAAEERDRSGQLAISVAGTTPAPDLAIEAANVALAECGHGADEIGAHFHADVHPQGPDGWSAPHYINRMTINQPVMSVEIRNGCIGFLSSLQLASCYLMAMPSRPAVLLTCADNFGTPSVDRWRASSLFVLADGGGSVVLSRRPGFARLLSIGSVSAPELEEQHRMGETLFPPGLTVGGSLNLTERSSLFRQQVAEGILHPTSDFGSVVIEAVEAVLKDADISLDDVARVVHDGFTHWAIRDLFLDPLGIEEEKGILDYTRSHGHGGPLDQLRGLEYLWRGGHVGVGDKVLLFAGAPGMEGAAAVVEITATPS
ncbi:ketoacyl-ACP synthase III family protein [Nocardia sp. NPDC051030]|uniref:ketoacyl-ACP synthase III family protein n=1 Tax=Nocardia sp. NPDC051030 TaxID=3155162 RepID=UPI00342F1E8B